MQKEIWTTAVYKNRSGELVESLYEISNLMGLRDCKGRRVVPNPKCRCGNRKAKTPKTYPCWTPSVDGRFVSLHSTVMFSFSTPPSSYTSQVDHINGDTSDWRLSNLRWTNPVLNHLNRHTSRGYVEMRPSKSCKVMRYKPQCKMLGRAYKLEPVESAIVATAQYRELRDALVKKVQPMFHEQKLTRDQVRKTLRDWCPNFPGVVSVEELYGQWGKRSRSSSEEQIRLSPFERAKRKTSSEESRPASFRWNHVEPEPVETRTALGYMPTETKAESNSAP